MFSWIKHHAAWFSASVLFCLVWGFLIEPTILKTRHHTIEIKKIQNDNIRIVFLSDIHFAGEHVNKKRVESIVQKINNLQPDLILFGGDFIDGHQPRISVSRRFHEDVDLSFAALKGLSASMGVYSVMGNHDVWYDAAYVKEKLIGSDIVVLDNSHIKLDRNLCLVGYADDMTQIPSETASKGCTNDELIISIMHSPDSLEVLDRSNLVLAGHTHGGQINLPFIGRRITSTRSGISYAYGLKIYKGIPVYITSGIGTSILPARFRSAPEIVILDLQ